MVDTSVNDDTWRVFGERFVTIGTLRVTLRLSCASFWQVGWYVTLHVSDVPVSVVKYFRQGAPLIAFSLLPYEQKVNQCFVGKWPSSKYFSKVYNILLIGVKGYHFD